MSYNGRSKQRRTITPEEWVPLAREVTRLANKWSNRTDILAYIGPGAGRGLAAALFDPDNAQIELDVEKAFGEDIYPELIGNLSERSVQFEWPVATGLVLHEAMHAKHSTWDLAEAEAALTPEEFTALSLLEETRVEKRAVETYPQNRQFLRAWSLGGSFDEDAMAEMQKLPGVRLAGQLAALSLARVDAGVLERRDIPNVETVIRSVLSDDIINRLRRVWVEMQAIRRPNSNLTKLYALAREWEAILKEESQKQGESDQNESGDGSGGGGLGQALMDALAEAVQKDAENTEQSASRQLDSQETQEREDAAEEERAVQRREQADNKEQAQKTFSSSSQGQRGATRSVVAETRKPTGEEHAAAVRIGQELEKAKYRDRDKTEVTSFTPPGRMRSGAVLQNAAYKSKNLPARAEPFRRSMRKHTDEPTLSIGMMTDVSGSMSAAMEPIAVANWVFSEASRRIQARIGSVYFGASVTPGLAPGHHLDQVHVRKAPDGYEAFDEGFRALDGGLNLLHGTGARLLVICSDGNYKGDEASRAKFWLKRCEQEGVGVLWLTFSGTYGSAGAVDICADTKVEIHQVEGSPTAAAYTIGARAAEALTRAGAGR